LSARLRVVGDAGTRTAQVAGEGLVVYFGFRLDREPAGTALSRLRACLELSRPSTQTSGLFEIEGDTLWVGARDLEGGELDLGRSMIGGIRTRVQQALDIASTAGPLPTPGDLAVARRDAPDGAPRAVVIVGETPPSMRKPFPPPRAPGSPPPSAPARPPDPLVARETPLMRDSYATRRRQEREREAAGLAGAPDPELPERLTPRAPTPAAPAPAAPAPAPKPATPGAPRRKGRLIDPDV